MRVLVTGAAGFVGAATVARLAVDHDVHTVIRPATDTWRLADSADSTEHRVDLVDLDTLRDTVETIDADVVVHAAAASDHPAPGHRVGAWRDTVLATISLLDALQHKPPQHFVNIGSSLQYTPSDRALRETDPTVPITARGVAKQAASAAIAQWGRENGVPVTELRVFRAYGNREQSNRLIPAIIRSLRTGTVLPVPTSTTRRDMVHVNDVAESCALAVPRPGLGLLNVGFGVAHSIEEIVQTFEDVAGQRIDIMRTRDLQTQDVEFWQADMERTEALLGWRPKVDLAAGARMILEQL